jgi:MFS family permease
MCNAVLLLRAGLVADRYGRRPCVLAGLFLASAAHIASALVPASSWAFPSFLFKLLLGIGLGTFLPAAFTVAMEFIIIPHRSATVGYMWILVERRGIFYSIFKMLCSTHLFFYYY